MKKHKIFQKCSDLAPICSDIRTDVKNINLLLFKTIDDN